MPFLGQKISAIKKQSPEIEIEMEIEHWFISISVSSDDNVLFVHTSVEKTYGV
jgi:hypothetical protein